MVVIIDLNPTVRRRLDHWMEVLALPKDVQMVDSVNCLSKDEDQVVYLTSLETGGAKYQLDLVRNNPSVAQWFIFSDGTERYLLDKFRDRVGGVAGQLFLCSKLEELEKAVKRCRVRKKTCLICTVTRRVDARPFADLLNAFLPDWTLECACLAEQPNAMADSTCQRVIILGERSGDFLLNSPVPEHIIPWLVQAGAERLIHENETELMERAYGGVRGLNWSDRMKHEHFFFVSVPYESWRQKNEGVSALRNNECFVMWDTYGLPVPLSVYTQENIDRFLLQFNGCEQLAGRLINNG